MEQEQFVSNLPVSRTPCCASSNCIPTTVFASLFSQFTSRNLSSPTSSVLIIFIQAYPYFSIICRVISLSSFFVSLLSMNFYIYPKFVTQIFLSKIYLNVTNACYFTWYSVSYVQIDCALAICHVTDRLITYDLAVLWNLWCSIVAFRVNKQSSLLTSCLQAFTLFVWTCLQFL